MTQAPNRIASIAGRLALVILGLALSLVLLEAALQAGAAYNRSRLRDDAPASLAGASRIACLGDSNTYGILMPRDQTYPAFFQQLLRAVPATEGVQVLNLGIPGTNSSLLRNRIAGVIDALRPDAVLVMIGANDFWTEPMPVADETSTWRQRLWSVSRVYRLFYMLARSAKRETTAGTVDPVREGDAAGGHAVLKGDTDVDLSWTGPAREDTLDWRNKLYVNLRVMAEMAARRGVKFVSMTYPNEGAAYGQANEVIRRAAADLPLIDLGGAFNVICPSWNCPEIFLPDGHPTLVGYQVAATLVWNAMRDADARVPAGVDTLPARFFPVAAPWLRRLAEAPVTVPYVSMPRAATAGAP
jgi:lysophospholipase L1-like esterase